MRLLFLLILFPFFSKAQFTGAEIARYKSIADRVTIIRDNWGVPHIYAKKDADVVFGLLYAQCEENFNKVEENTLEMLGRLAEVRGKEYLYQDLQMRMIYDSAKAVQDYKNAPSWFRLLMDAAADGINYYLAKHPEVKPAILRRFEPWYALMRTDGSISATQTGGLSFKDMQNLYGSDLGNSFLPRRSFVPEENSSGSNGFAIAPSRSESGNALLYINPHVTFYFRTEVHMVSEEGLNTYGAVTWSNFFVYQGFNEFCGWMHTSGYADVADLFVEKIEKRADRYFYQLDGKWHPVNTRKIEISFLDNGALKHQTFTTYATAHGPVMGSRDGHWLSLKENNRSLGALLQSWLRTKAKGFTDFSRIMNMRENNSNNTVFADNKGNIAYWHGNFLPRRDTAFDYSLPVDGSISATDWKGKHELSEMVHVYNPPSGWIQNCNSTPYTSAGTSSPNPSNYPLYMAPDGENFRGINAVRLLSKSGKLNINTLITDVGYNRYLAAFDILLPSLFSAFDRIEKSDSLKLLIGEAIDSLKGWNKTSASNSVPSAIAIEWASRMSSKAVRPSNPYKLTDAVSQVQSMVSNTSDREKIMFLAETLTDLQQRFGSWKITWGEINRYQRPVGEGFDDNRLSMPVGLAASTWGALPSFVSRRFQGTDKRYGYSGNSFIASVEFGKTVQARTIITGGQSFDPKSKHFTDQAEGFINGRFKNVLFYKADVLKNAQRTYHPGE